MKCEVGREWTWTKVGRICKTNVSSYSPSERWPFVNYLETKGIMGGRISEIQHIILAKQRLPSRARRKVSKNDIVYSTVRPNQRHYGIIKEPLPNMLVSTGFSVLTVDTAQCDATFLYYWLSQNRIVETLQALAEQSVSTYPTIRDADLEALEILLPPLSVQKRIAAILSALDDKIELNNKISANLEQQAQAVFTAWFAEAKPSVSFVSLVRVLGGGTPRTSVAEFWEGEIPFFTPKDVYGVYTLETEKSLTDDGLAHCNSCLFPINTVFVTARGTVGKLTLAGRPMAMNQSCYALLGQEGYGQYFIYHLTQRVITHLKHKANGAVFDAIVTRDFESEFVPDIKPSEAANFELKVKPFYEAILRNYEENCRLSALRDMLLPHLLSGACVMS